MKKVQLLKHGLIYIQPNYFYSVCVIHYVYLTQISAYLFINICHIPTKFMTKKKHSSVVIYMYCIMSCSEIFLSQDGVSFCSMGCTRGGNNSWSTDMTGQILPFYHAEFSLIIDITSHLFLFSNWCVCQRYLENRTTFKRIPRFFTGDNLITTLCSVYIQLHQMIKPLLIDMES